jgi:hypothetical protein
MRGVDEQCVASLVAAAGIGAMRSIVPLAGGANNRVYRVETSSRVALLKSYFRHPDDPRDRLGTDFAFARCAWDGGVRAIPQPFACDPEAGLGLFEFVSGRALLPTEIDDWALNQALEFFHGLCRVKRRPEASLLPCASESCFSLDDHFALVQRRVDRLASIAPDSASDEAAATFVRNELTPHWAQMLAGARASAARHGLSTTDPLRTSEWCLSPSDFGYHNAILADDGRLRFFDFEYAGWDDPSKLICDFFSQPALPAPITAYERFARAVAAELPSPDRHLARAALLLPVYRLKWCCILLNEFLPVGGRRRAFSGTEFEFEQRKVRQLDKARESLAAILRESQSPTRKVA